MSLMETAERQMANRDCLAGVFGSAEDGHRAVEDLKADGFTDSQISLVTRGDQHDLNGAEPLRQGDEMEKSAAVGAAAGAAAGLLAGSSLFLIPGLGPVVFVGAMASGMTGGIVGGLIGAMSGWGIKKDRLVEYEDLVRAGKTLVLVTGTPPQLADAKSVLRDSLAERVTLHAESADSKRVDP
jgi:hypothetical protein